MARRRYRSNSAGGAGLIVVLAIAAAISVAIALVGIAIGVAVTSIALQALWWSCRITWAEFTVQKWPDFPELWVFKALSAWEDGSQQSTYAPMSARPVNAATRSGLTFEVECAAAFRARGWHVTTTPASGDHGADLIVRNGSRIVAVQCKNYRGRAGNRAVQEIYAARAYYNAHDAVVICPGGFTKHAEQMASRIGVKLKTSP
ncbi:restriction endonuclease [Gluconobacter japonicus]|uniref:restriction endonuclease n=1 Tax=Gluconobacter japonicus TaxID=376620 RepID=UPI001B8D97F3|nr:restriction endonuclease [Gluconobacter japonicus]MBS1050473.1 restriction endonuclease [Gluconobacter japonicus]